MPAPVKPADYHEARQILFDYWFYSGEQTYFDQYDIDTDNRVMHVASPKGRVKCHIKYDPTVI